MHVLLEHYKHDDSDKHFKSSWAGDIPLESTPYVYPSDTSIWFCAVTRHIDKPNTQEKQTHEKQPFQRFQVPKPHVDAENNESTTFGSCKIFLFFFYLSACYSVSQTLCHTRKICCRTEKVFIFSHLCSTSPSLQIDSHLDENRP